MHSDDLRIRRQLGREKDNRNEDEQRTEHIHIIRYKIEIVVNNDLAQRNLLLKEVVYLLGDIKHNSYRQNQHYREKERSEELANDIPIQAFHSRVIICGITEAIHAS